MASIICKIALCTFRIITFQDVEEFCHNPAIQNSSQPESNLVEYKGWISSINFEKFVEKIVKETVSFANSDGGLIFIGIEEEKNSGGRRDYAGEVGTLPLKHAESLKQSIEDNCKNLIKPSFIPEIHIVPRPDTDKSVLLVRIDPDKISRPLLFKVDEGKWIPFVRVYTKQLIPTWDEIVQIAEKREEDKLAVERQKYMLYLVPNRPPFWYCFLRLSLRGRYHSCQFGMVKEFWSTEDIEQLATAVGKEVLVPTIGWQVFPWKAVFHPDFSRFTGPCEINQESTIKTVTFTPRPQEKMWEEIQKEAKKHYLLKFNRLGLMEGFAALFPTHR